MSFDDRLRDGLRQDTDTVLPDTDRHLAEVLGRTRAGASTTSLLVVAAAAAMVIAVLVLGVLPGSHLTTPGTTATPPQATATAAPSGLAGTEWTVTLLASDPGVAELGLGGDWTLRLRERSGIELIPPDGFARASGLTSLTGVYGFDQGRIVTNAFARDFGPTCAGAGSYQADLVDGRLTLSGTDICRIRHIILATTPWTRADA